MANLITAEFGQNQVEAILTIMFTYYVLMSFAVQRGSASTRPSPRLTVACTRGTRHSSVAARRRTAHKSCTRAAWGGNSSNTRKTTPSFIHTKSSRAPGTERGIWRHLGDTQQTLWQVTWTIRTNVPQNLMCMITDKAFLYPFSSMNARDGIQRRVNDINLRQ